MNFEQARSNMIEQQIKPWDVPNQSVLDLISEIHREDFVPDEYKRLAFADTRIPLAHGQVMMTPKVVRNERALLSIRPSQATFSVFRKFMPLPHCRRCADPRYCWREHDRR